MPLIFTNTDLLLQTVWLLGVVIAGVAALLRGRGQSRSYKALRFLLVFCLVYGGVAASLPIMNVTSQGKVIPPDLEWPIISATGVAIDDAGHYIVSHPPTSRVQVYDSAKKFIHGWYVEARGGNFQLQTTSENQIEVITVRGDFRYLYDTNGVLLAKDTYPQDYWSNFPRSERAVRLNRSIFWLPFANIQAAFALGVLGAVGLKLLPRGAKSKEEHDGTP